MDFDFIRGTLVLYVSYIEKYVLGTTSSIFPTLIAVQLSGGDDKSSANECRLIE